MKTYSEWEYLKRGALLRRNELDEQIGTLKKERAYINVLLQDHTQTKAVQKVRKPPAKKVVKREKPQLVKGATMKALPAPAPESDLKHILLGDGKRYRNDHGSIEKMVEEILVKANKPLHARELAITMHRDFGWVTGASDLRIFQSALYGNRRFVHEGDTWSLKPRLEEILAQPVENEEEMLKKFHQAGPY